MITRFAFAFALSACLALPAMAQTINEDFDWPAGSGNTSPDGVWRIAGPWTGTGGNFLDPALAEVSGGQLSLTVAAGEMRGSEIQTLPTYGYGYYETSMRVSSVPGVVNSFFVISEGYDSSTIEIDVEFLTNESWINSNVGRVHFVLHPSGEQRIVDLPFNPAHDFHRYGFLWEPGMISYTVDGEIVATNADPASDIGPDPAVYIMMNAWTGNPNWGGGPPAQDATATYEWVRHYAGATEVISDGTAPDPEPEPEPNPDLAGVSLWPDTPPPAQTDSDRDAVELGVRFRPSTDGYIVAVRFYEPAASEGAHPVALWSSSGTLLASQDYAGGSDAGWRVVTFDEPVPVQANTRYVASYHAPNGRYAATGGYSWPVSVEGLTGLAGVYTYGPAGSFPVSTYNSSNYWADVVFSTEIAQPEPEPEPEQPTTITIPIEAARAIADALEDQTAQP